MSSSRNPQIALYVLILLALVLLPLPAAAQDSPVSPTGKVLRVSAGATLPAHFDPQRNAWNDEIMVSLLDFEGLTALDEESGTVPAAADSWEFSQDGLTATFHLRDGLTYSDGSPLTAERFRYAIQRSCDPQTAAPYAAILFPIVGCEELNGSLSQDLEMLTATPAATPAADALAAYEAAIADLGVEAPDDQTLIIHLEQPAAYLPTIAATWVFYPIKQEIVEANPDWWQDPAQRIGNGVFRAVDFDLSEDSPRLSFAANEHYWGGRANLDGIEFVYGIEPGAGQIEAFRQDEVDIAWVWADVLPEVEADAALRDQILRYALADTTTLTFNLNREPFQDQKVREAFAYAFDRQRYCDEFQAGTCVPAYSWIPPGVPGAIETDAFAFDPEAARQALADSSYGSADNLPEITFYYVPEWAGEPEAKWLADNYRENLGIEITIAPLDVDAYLEKLRSAENWPDLAFWGWTQDYPDPQNWLSISWTCGNVMYPGMIGYCNEEADALIRQADAATDPEQRLALYEEAGRLIVADAPVVFRSNTIAVALVKPYVTGFSTASRDFWPGMSSMLTVDLSQETVPASEATPAA